MNLTQIIKFWISQKQNIFNLSKKVVENNEFICNQIPKELLENKKVEARC